MIIVLKILINDNIINIIKSYLIKKILLKLILILILIKY